MNSRRIALCVPNTPQRFPYAVFMASLLLSLCVYQSQSVNLWTDRLAAFVPACKCVSLCNPAPSPPRFLFPSPISLNTNMSGTRRKNECGGGDGCVQMLTLLCVCNNNPGNREDKSYRHPKCLFSAIVKSQTVAGGDKLRKKNTIWQLF